MTAREDKAARQRQLHNERAWRYRYRQHPSRREKIVRVAICAGLVDFLIRLQWLNEHERNNREQIGDAIRRLLKDASRNA